METNSIDMSSRNPSSGFGSSNSPFFNNTQHSRANTSTALTDDLRQINLQRASQIPSRSSQSQSKPYQNNFSLTRKNLLDNTLQHMHNVSQNKYTQLQRKKM